MPLSLFLHSQDVKRQDLTPFFCSRLEECSTFCSRAELRQQTCVVPNGGMVRFLLIKKCRVGACALEDDGAFVNSVDEQPVSREVAFPPALEVPHQFMIAKFRGQ